MDREKLIDILIVVIIAAIGLFTAFLTFGILKSQASAEIQQYSVGGAIAGALVSWGVLGTLYRQFRQSSDAFHQLQESNEKLQEALHRGDQIKQLQETNEKLQELLQHGDELKDLRKRNEELQQKLIRSAPKPDDFEIEISDREKIVLARPSKWIPRGGIIFEFELPPSAMQEDDTYPAQFHVSHIKIDETTGTADEYYQYFENYYGNPDYYDGYTSEYIDLGGEPFGIRSLKVIVLEYCRIEVYEDPKTKVPRFNRYWISPQEYREKTQQPAPVATAEPNTTSGTQATETAPDATPVTDAASQAGNPADHASSTETTSNDGSSNAADKPTTFYHRVMHMAVACYHKPLGTIYFFEFWDDVKDFTHMSASFNQILRSTRFLT